eukprot:TRINITY_DN3980_c1_g1_i1.p1 TRINITY_DN3980_c1_g1~~TRINITY_DN3980_c1_g1_i1.p1  ORF type:complete len:336 (-),score=63.92 TRINITY_DN3980_c1_g1_i1:20-922(-)
MSEKKNVVVDGWFAEKSTLWPGQAMSIEVEEVLVDEQTKYQELMVFKSKTYGNVLILDGCIQITERDEFSYQEMIANLPLFSLDDPKSVLIIGGGDGGVLSQVVNHKSVTDITMCEIDEVVISSSKTYFPKFADAWNDPRFTLELGCGKAYMEKIAEGTRRFDVIIVDSSDPIGPAESLFTREFYELMNSALAPGGVVCTQSECLWLHLDLITEMVTFSRQMYEEVAYGITSMPTYPSGQIGFLIGRKEGGPAGNPISQPRRVPSTDTLHVHDTLEYYSERIHSAAFVLPRFAEKRLAAE